MSELREPINRFGLTPEEYDRRINLLGHDPVYQASRRTFLVATNAGLANDIGRIMDARRNWVLQSPNPDKIVQQAQMLDRMNRAAGR